MFQPSHHDRSLSGISKVPESTPTTLLTCRPSLRPHSPVARDAISCVFYDSKHAVGVCGTIQARTHMQLALSCHQSLLKVQHRLRLTMHHVYGHAGNLGNECADHAAALCALGLVSSHNLSTRWTHHSFDSTSCSASCHNLGDVSEKLRISQSFPSHNILKCSC